MWAWCSLVFVWLLDLSFWFLFDGFWYAWDLYDPLWFYLCRCILDFCSWAFYGFYFLLASFFFLSTQGTFIGDGHLFSVFAIPLSFSGALHRHSVEQGYP